jgi:hypothetical protein
MKKTFHLTHPKIKTDDYWDFDCKLGHTEEEATPVHVAELTERINDIQARQLTSFYVEIIAKKGRRLMV